MSWKIQRAHYFKIALLIFWISCILGVYGLFLAADIPLSTVPKYVQGQAMAAGLFGPLVILAVYAFQTVIPFPSPALAVIAGALYGPWLGSLITLFGINLSGSISFVFGRYFGRHFVTEYEKDWIKKYDDILAQEGFLTMLFMRLLFFPYDIVSILAGLSRITYRQYALGTFLGTIPSTVTFVVLGRAFGHPRSWILFGTLAVLILVLVYFIRKSKWAKDKIFIQKDPKMFEG